MKRVFFGADGRLRNGWWIALFVALLVLSRFAYRPVSAALQGLGATPEWLGPLPVLFLLAVTWCCTRLRRTPLASVGLQLDRRWWQQAATGLAVGMASMLAIAACIAVAGGVRFEVASGSVGNVLLAGAYAFAFAALLEELLARGFVFQRLVDGIGPLAAQLLVAAAFALAHGENPNMDGATRAWAMLDIALGSLIYGLAFLRTRSLALPIGMHLGWNWMQGGVLGFSVSGFESNGWLHAIPLPAPAWLGGGAFGAEASVFAPIVDLVVLVALWRWRGPRSAPATSAGDAPAPLAQATSG